MATIRCKNCGIQVRRRDNGRFAIYCKSGGPLMAVQNIRQVKAKISRLTIAVRYYRDPINVISADAAKRAVFVEIELIEAHKLFLNLLH